MATCVIGFDGWKGGWIGIRLINGAFDRAVSGPALAPLLEDHEDADVVGVDMPIGLPDEPPRAADVAAKALLGRRSSTVYFTPPRIVLSAPSYAEARAVSTARFGRSISAQSYALRRRILEVDVLAGDPRLHEVHPEVTFREMAGGTIDAPKRTWAGQMARRRALSNAGIVLPDDLGDANDVPPDDVFDAAAVAWSACRIAAGTATPLPEHPPIDGTTGRPVAIWC